MGYDSWEMKFVKSVIGIDVDEVNSPRGKSR